MPNPIKCALPMTCAFYRLQHDYSIDALFCLNMTVLKKCLITVGFLKILTIMNAQYSSIWHSGIYPSLFMTCAFFRLQHDYSIDALFSLNMSALLAYHGVGDVNIGVKGEPRWTTKACCSRNDRKVILLLLLVNHPGRFTKSSNRI